MYSSIQMLPHFRSLLACGYGEFDEAQTWNLSQASQACLCKFFGAGVNFYLEYTQFVLQICVSLCTRPCVRVSYQRNKNP